MSIEIPETVVACDGCGKDLNILDPYLNVQVKAQREVLVSKDQPQTGDLNEIAAPLLYLGTKSGRGVIRRFHGFDCLGEWVGKRKGLTAKLEIYAESGDPYVPEDNRTPEELVKSGELPKEFLKFQEAAAEFVPTSVVEIYAGDK